MALGFEELQFYFKIVGVILGIWALVLVVRGFKHFSSSEERRTWLVLLYAVFMFFIARVFDGLGLLFGDRIDEGFIAVMTMIIEAAFFAILFYVVYIEIVTMGSLPFLLHAKPEASNGELQDSQIVPGQSYITEVSDTSYLYGMFYEMVTHGHEGLIFTREYPDRLRERYGFKETPIIWLSREGKGNSLRPSDLEQLNHAVQDFLKKSKNGLVVLDGFEYLSTYNGFGKLVKLIHDLRDASAVHGAALIVVVYPGTVTERELNYLKKDLRPLSMGD